MFAGVASIILNEDNTIIEGISSREGEEVKFSTPVSIAEHPKINEWLTLVEKEMRFTLAKYLASAVKDMTAFKHGKIEADPFLKWMDKYQVLFLICFYYCLNTIQL